MQAIKNIFGGNTATKKTHKNLLKRQYENFVAISTEVIEQTYERLQNLISQLEMHGEVIPQEDINQKFLRSLSQEWTMHTIVWRNKQEIETLSLDDLFNNLKAYESEVKGTSSSTTNSHNVAFLSSSSTNSATRAVNTAQGVKICYLRVEGPTNFALMAYSSTSSTSSTNSEVSNNSNWHNAVPPPYTGNFMPPKSDLVYPSLDDFVDVNESVSESVVEKPTIETNKPETARKENRAPIIKDWVSDSDEENVPKVKIVEMFNKPSFAKINFVKSIEQVKSPRKTLVDKNRRPFNKITPANNNNFTKKVNIVKGTRVNTARPKAVISAVKGNKGNVVKASTCWVWRPKHKILDHVSRNNGASFSFKRLDYIDTQDYKEIDGGFVAFGGNSKGGKITRKGKIRTGKLDFKDMYFVKELKFNLFSVSQMCDKKNSVLFTDTECTQDPPFSSSPKDSPDVGFKPSGEEEMKDVEDPGNEGDGCQESLFIMKDEEESYVCQPPGLEDPYFPDKVYKVVKALYGLYQAPKAWYETLSTYLLENRFQRGQIDKTLFIKRDQGDILIVQVYVDDIIFGSTKKKLCTEFEKMMHKKFQMSSMGELTFFLGLQVKQKEDRIFISPRNSYFLFFEVSDIAGASQAVSKKSTTGGCQFLGCRLISWQCKKQTVVANSITEAEYVAASSCYGQVLWIQNQLLDYGYNFMHTKIYIDNERTICIVKKTKHIEIRHHFIRDSNEKKLIQMIKIHTNKNVADLLTKAFDISRFQYLIASIGMLNL
ncbi:putative ribonuclease H-like domain-containing protein [Tanacetum coccineum]|uniref:Ribonuclease H-like domain-containing protein n=1 Tax=Tanacetum coccineum TaxID=301880 RepID=A0ABQ4YTZ8_9ASTR